MYIQSIDKSYLKTGVRVGRNHPRSVETRLALSHDGDKASLVSTVREL